MSSNTPEPLLPDAEKNDAQNAARNPRQRSGSRSDALKISKTQRLHRRDSPHITFPPSPPVPGAQVGPYRLLEVIGRGGMGIVYRAVHTTLDRHVALKLLSRHQPEHSVTDMRFRQEARAIAKLHHSNIVPLFEVGEAEGVAFLVMQLIEGDSLDQVIGKLRRQPANSESVAPVAAEDHCRQAATIGRQAAEALAYAHSRGISHRDVKPSNLIVDDDGVAWYQRA